MSVPIPPSVVASVEQLAKLREQYPSDKIREMSREERLNLFAAMALFLGETVPEFAGPMGVEQLANTMKISMLMKATGVDIVKRVREDLGKE